jgi:hypothetical protein
MSAQANILGFLATFIKKAKSSLQIYAIDLEVSFQKYVAIW